MFALIVSAAVLSMSLSLPPLSLFHCYPLTHLSSNDLSGNVGLGGRMEEMRGLKIRVRGVGRVRVEQEEKKERMKHFWKGNSITAAAGKDPERPASATAGWR